MSISLKPFHSKFIGKAPIMYMQVIFAWICVILSTLGGETIANIADDKDAVEEGRSLGGGVGFALLPLFMLGVRKCKIYNHTNYDQF